VLERIHGSVLQQIRALERGEKVFFHLRKGAAGNGIARDQDQFHGLGKFMLVQAEAFAEQAPGAAAHGRIPDLFAGDHAEFWCGASRQLVPVGDEAAKGQSFALLPDAREIAALRKPRRTAQTQAFRRGIHEIKPA